MEAAIRKNEEQDTVTVGIFPYLRISLTKIFTDAKFF